MDTYEKKYKEALERAKRLYKDAVTLQLEQDIKDYETIFPELKESEDEKIKKAVIEMIHDTPNVECEEIYNVRKEDVLVWLEKQGEKPADKVEPKFKVGDWIVGSNSVYKVISLNDELNCYIVINVNNEEIKIPYYFDCGPNHMCSYHLWNIADAKDGDVLVYNNSLVEIILLFEKWIDGVGEVAYSYAHTFDNKILFDDWSDCDYSAHPATKEQRDFLFQKIREAGYKWDAEKKELKKIEHEPKWSKEDEELLQHCCGAIAAADYYTLEDKEEIENWLKSLKQRLEE